ncbi:MAG: hypothetical protein R3D62_15260 [Xanthobacteraceae bacterium]
MSHAPHLPATHTESSEPVVAETDYEALTEALMQTRRGRWFLAEHARRCREADHTDLRAVLARIEQALAEPRAPAGLAEIQEKLGALPRIEQMLADYRDPPAMAELRESLGALTRIEEMLAEPREPAGLAEIQEKLGALPRIEQTLADYRDPPAMAELRESLGALTRIEQALAGPQEVSGIAELHDRVAAFAQTLEGVRAEVAAQRPAEPDADERARDRERDEEMLRLLHEQRERLDALADIWARVSAPTAPELAASEPPPDTASVAGAADPPGNEPDVAQPVEPQPEPAVEASGTSGPPTAEDTVDRIEPETPQASMVSDAPTSTAELLNQTLIFGPGAEPPPQTEDTMSAETMEDDGAAVDPASDGSTEGRADEQAAAADLGAVAQTVAVPAPSQDDQAAPAVAEAAVRTTSADPIVQMFIDREPPASPADARNQAEPVTTPDASVLPEQKQLPAWLVGDGSGRIQTASDGEIAAAPGDVDVVAGSAEAEPMLEAVIDEDAALFEPEPMPETASDAEADTEAPLQLDPNQEVAAEQKSFAQPSTDSASAPAPEPQLHPETKSAQRFSTEVQSAPSSEAALSITSEPPDLAELTLDLLQKALFSDPARAPEPAPSADTPALADSFTKAVAESDLHAAIAALRRALGRENRDGLESESPSEVVVLDDLPVSAPPPASVHASEPEAPARAAARASGHSASTASDPLAPVDALSEEERIALFS